MARSARTIPAVSFTVVMATGIVAIAAEGSGWRRLGQVLLAIAALEWVLLTVAAGFRLLGAPPDLTRRGAVEGVAGAFSFPAGTAVLGAALSRDGHQAPATALWVVAVAAWVALAGGAAIAVRRSPRSSPTPTWLLVVIATESLAVLAVVPGRANRTAPLVGAAVAWWVLGLLLYAAVAVRLAPHDRLVRRRPEHLSPSDWVDMGAFSIAAVAGSELALMGRHAPIAGTLHAAIGPLATAVWAAASALLPVLVVAEVRRARARGRPPRYELQRWGTVFPLGTYATASAEVGRVLRLGALARLADAFVVIALVVWALTAAGMGRRLARRPNVSAPGET